MAEEKKFKVLSLREAYGVTAAPTGDDWLCGGSWGRAGAAPRKVIAWDTDGNL